MVLRAIAGNDKVRVEDLKFAMERFLGNSCESVWSIEIALLLKIFGACEVKLVTKSAKVANEEYRTKKFYASEFEGDRDRVKKAFETAESEEGVYVDVCDEVEDDLFEKYFHAMEKNNVLIVLVDKKSLERGYDFVESCSLSSVDDDDEFVGHYVCVSGVKGDYFLINDPARPEIVRCRKHVLHRARKVHGTDSDVIVIDRCRKIDDAMMTKTLREIHLKIGSKHSIEY